MDTNHTPPRLEAEEARSGHIGDGVRYILLASLTLVVIALTVLAFTVFG